jgi:hypothetical protein
MVGATAIDLTAFVRSRTLNLFVRFVRFVVKHPVSGPHEIGQGKADITNRDVESGLLSYGTHAKNCPSFRRRHVISRPQLWQSSAAIRTSSFLSSVFLCHLTIESTWFAYTN